MAYIHDIIKYNRTWRGPLYYVLLSELILSVRERLVSCYLFCYLLIHNNIVISVAYSTYITHPGTHSSSIFLGHIRSGLLSVFIAASNLCNYIINNDILAQ